MKVRTLKRKKKKCPIGKAYNDEAYSVTFEKKYKTKNFIGTKNKKIGAVA